MAIVANTSTRCLSAISFALGAAAALPEFLPARLFTALRRPVHALRSIAPHGGRFLDGYDCVADFAARRAY